MASFRAAILLSPSVASVTSAVNGTRQVIAVMRQRLERGEPVARMYGTLGLAWLQRQAEIAEQLMRQREGR